MNGATTRFRAARDLLLECRGDPDAARARFRWPELPHFNWALDWFDHIAEGNDRPALRVLTPGADRATSFAQLAESSARTAGWLASLGVRPQDRVVMVLDTRVEVWEIQLALAKIQAVAVPLFTSLPPEEIAERLRRCRADHIVTSREYVDELEAAVPGRRILLDAGPDGCPSGWDDHRDARSAQPYLPTGPTPAGSLLSCFFTSGSTARPKLVAHTHVSYPVGHLTGMFWANLGPGDVHLNVSSPGWAKHPWSSLYAPWNAEATVVAVDTRDARPTFLLDALGHSGATSFCAPPTIWRSLVRHGLPATVRLREAMSVGEPLTDDIVEAVRDVWGVTVRNGYGQSEMTAITGVTATGTDDPRSMGRALPGYRVALLPPVGSTVPDLAPDAELPPGAEPAMGELCVDIAAGALGLMHGYLDDSGARIGSDPSDARWYRTGDLAEREPDGSLRFVGRLKDVFHTAGGRLVAPAALEGALVGHPAVAEAAVVAVRVEQGWAAKGYVVPAAGWNAGPVTAQALLSCMVAAGPLDAIVEFVDELPRTESGKIYREALRDLLRSPLAEFSLQRADPPGAGHDA